MSSPFGHEMYLYRQTTGTREAWPEGSAPDNLSEITVTRDVTLNCESVEDDDTDRGSDWVLTDTGLKDATLEVNIRDDHSDSHYQALRSAWEAGSTVAIAALDGPSTTAGSEGMWADWIITSFKRGEPLKGKATVDVTLRIARTDVAPDWVVVTT